MEPLLLYGIWCPTKIFTWKDSKLCNFLLLFFFQKKTATFFFRILIVASSKQIINFLVDAKLIIPAVLAHTSSTESFPSKTVKNFVKTPHEAERHLVNQRLRGIEKIHERIINCKIKSWNIKLFKTDFHHFFSFFFIIIWRFSH